MHFYVRISLKMCFSHGLRWKLLPVFHNEYTQWCSVGKHTALLNNSLEFHKVMMLFFSIAEDRLPLPLVLQLGKAHQVKIIRHEEAE